MVALYSFLIIIFLSIVIIRIGSTALELTGLSEDVAAFQAQSAFSGVGYTTKEAEVIVSHPVRRKIIRVLVLLGSAGMTSSIATLILTFTQQSNINQVTRLAILLGGIGVLYLFARSRLIKKGMKKVIVKALDRFTSVRVLDYEQLLGLSKGYNISRLTVREESWIANRKLKELNLPSEGAIILAVYRHENGEDKYMGVPDGDTLIQPGDTLICYSREDVSKELAERLKGFSGDREHEERVQEEEQRSRMREMRGGYEE
jgi:hypothetical protein